MPDDLIYLASKYGSLFKIKRNIHSKTKLDKKTLFKGAKFFEPIGLQN